MFRPLTMLVLIVSGLLLLAGALLLRRRSGARLPSAKNSCPRCGRENTANATYCGQCGGSLTPRSEPAD